jgi:hypothetical protein
MDSNSNEQRNMTEAEKALASLIAGLSMQLVDVQATLNLLVDLEKAQMIASGRTVQETDQFLATSFRQHRTTVLESVKSRLRQAHLDAILDGLDSDVAH